MDREIGKALKNAVANLNVDNLNINEEQENAILKSLNKLEDRESLLETLVKITEKEEVKKEEVKTYEKR